MTNLLEVRHLSKTYRVRGARGFGKISFTANADVSLSLRPGGSLAVVGESGSGKSTIARILVGLERATSGEVTINGDAWDPTARISSGERRRRSKIVQMVFQDPYQSLDRRQTVRSALLEVLHLHEPGSRGGQEARALELLEQVGLEAKHLKMYPRALSGGQRQRVAIAKALAVRPELLILDEAVSALDVSVQAQVLALLAQIRRDTGMAFLFITHDLAVVQEIAEDVVVMRKGEIVEKGAVSEVLSRPQHAYTRRLMASVPRPGWVPRRWLNTTQFRVPASANGDPA